MSPIRRVESDERRTQINRMAVRPEYEEIALPGVHAGIGGSYLMGFEDPLCMNRPVGLCEPCLCCPFGAVPFPVAGSKSS
jgi:hypothetical protein